MKVNLLIMHQKDMGNNIIKINYIMKDNLKKVKEMVMEHIFGNKEVIIKENIKMIYVMVMEF